MLSDTLSIPNQSLYSLISPADLTIPVFRLSHLSPKPVSTVRASVSALRLQSSRGMDSKLTTTEKEVAKDFRPFLVIYKDGTVERLLGASIVPPSLDPETGVQSKDVSATPDDTVSARLYLPTKLNNPPEQKLPLVIYFHGGGFCVESATSPTYHNYLNRLSSQANVVVVSVEYRRAPEHALPIAYQDSWDAVEWVVRKSDPWLTDHVDYDRVFFAGDSAGANIAHHMGIKAGEIMTANANDTERLSIDGNDMKITGILLLCPYFWGKDPIGNEADQDENKKGLAAKLWTFVCPGTSGCDDPLINPAFDTNLSKLGCKKVLVYVAEKDGLRDRGFYYKEVLEKSGWNKGVVEVVEAKGEDHVFFLFNRDGDSAVAMMKKVVDFINHH